MPHTLTRRHFIVASAALGACGGGVSASAGIPEAPKPVTLPSEALDALRGLAFDLRNPDLGKTTVAAFEAMTRIADRLDAILGAGEHPDARLIALEAERQAVLAEWPEDCDDATMNAYGDRNRACIEAMMEIPAATVAGLRAKAAWLYDEANVVGALGGIDGDLAASIGRDLGLLPTPKAEG